MSAYARLVDTCETAVLAGRRQSAETVLALSTAGEFDTALASILRGLAKYADDHQNRYQSPLADDYVLGPAWLAALAGLLTLLNGETGRLDCGDVDRAIRDVAEAAGFTRDLGSP